MGKSDPLLLLDNGTLAYILGNGEYRFTNLKFDEAKAIIEMKEMCIRDRPSCPISGPG